MLKALSAATMRMSHFTDQRNRLVVAYGIKQNRLNFFAPNIAIDISDDSSHSSSGVKSALSSVY